MATNIATLGVKLTADIGKFSRGMRTAQTEMGFTARNAGRMTAGFENSMRKGISLGAVAQGLGAAFHVVAGAFRVAAIAGTALLAILVKVGTAVAKVFSDYEAKQKRLEAVSRGTRKEFDELYTSIRRLSEDTEFNVDEIMGGSIKLGMAGMDANTIDKTKKAMADLATIGQTDLVKTGDIASNIMSGFSLKAEDFTRVADTMAMTVSSTNTNIQQLGDAMKYAAVQSVASKISFEETSAALGLMGNAGIQGEMAGTSFRNIITRLDAPAKKSSKVIKALGADFSEAAIKAGGMVHILEELERTGAGKKAITQIFQMRAATGLLVLLQEGPKRLKYFTDFMKENTGAAQQMADVMRDSLGTQLRKVQNRFHNLAIVAGEQLGTAIRTVIDVFSEGSLATVDWDQKIRAFTRGGIFFLIDGMISVIDVFLRYQDVMTTTAKGVSVLGKAIRMIGKALVIFLMGSMTASLKAVSGFASLLRPMARDLMASDWGYKKKIGAAMLRRADILEGAGDKALKNLKTEMAELNGMTLDTSDIDTFFDSMGKGAVEGRVKLVALREALAKNFAEMEKKREVMNKFKAGLDKIEKGPGVGDNNPDVDDPTGGGNKAKKLDQYMGLKALADIWALKNKKVAVGIRLNRELRMISDKAAKEEWTQQETSLALMAARLEAQRELIELIEAERAAKAAAMKSASDAIKASKAKAEAAAIKEQNRLLDINRRKWEAKWEAETKLRKMILDQARKLPKASGGVGVSEQIADAQKRYDAMRLTGVDRENSAAERHNELLIAKAAAIDSVTSALMRQAEMLPDLAQKFQNAEGISQKLVVTTEGIVGGMQMLSAIGPAVFAAMGMNAKEQAKAQAILNIALGVFALGMALMATFVPGMQAMAPGFYMAAAAFGAKGAAGLAQGSLANQSMRTNTAVNVAGSSSKANQPMSLDDFIEGLKEAGLYKVGWEKLTIDEYGSTPVAVSRTTTGSARSLDAARREISRVRL